MDAGQRSLFRGAWLYLNNVRIGGANGLNRIPELLLHIPWSLLHLPDHLWGLDPPESARLGSFGLQLEFSLRRGAAFAASISLSWVCFAYRWVVLMSE